ncbi:MAG: ribosome small subunit-dependent GTPase A [Gaiellaceae bacterium]
MSQELAALGWSPSRAEEFVPHAAAGCVPARVGAQHRGGYVVYSGSGERPAEAAGQLRHAALGPADLPAVGDWVAVRDAPEADAATIHALLPRRTVFSRKAAGEAVEQVVAANVDVVFLVGAFGADLNVRRLERYLAAGWDSGADPVVVLNKSDLADDLAAATAEVEAVAFGVPVHVVSAADGTGLEGLARHLEGNRTAALLGSSGVGKSSLVNQLLGSERQDVAELRSDGRGRHTTTYRELIPLPGGGLVLDTPGMRELGLWDAGDGVDQTFADVAELAAACRFRDCAHEGEPACAVLAAVADGRLAAERLESYRKLLRELRHLELKGDPRALAEARRRRRRFARSLRRSAY